MSEENDLVARWYLWLHKVKCGVEYLFVFGFSQQGWRICRDHSCLFSGVKLDTKCHLALVNTNWEFLQVPDQLILDRVVLANETGCHKIANWLLVQPNPARPPYISLKLRLILEIYWCKPPKKFVRLMSMHEYCIWVLS